MVKMKIKKVGEDDAVEIPSSDINEFKKDWKAQGGSIIEEKDMELIVKNKDGKIVHLFVVGNTIFPFDFGEENEKVK